MSILGPRHAVAPHVKIDVFEDCKFVGTKCDACKEPWPCSYISREVDVDAYPNDDNEMMPEHLTMWGVDITAQFREHPRLHVPPGDLPPRTTKTTEVVLALVIKDSAQYSPEAGRPVILGSSDVERLRDLIWCAEERGLLEPLRVVEDPHRPPEGDLPSPLHGVTTLAEMEEIHRRAGWNLNKAEPKPDMNWPDEERDDLISPKESMGKREMRARREAKLTVGDLRIASAEQINEVLKDRGWKLAFDTSPGGEADG